MPTSETEAFEAAVASAAAFRRGCIALGLGRIRAALRRLGHPERHLPPVIHIAGTNGKGSTAAFADALLQAHGLRTAVYTSPHLVHFNERLRLPEGPVQLQAFRAALDQVRGTKAALTPFEAITAASLWLIARSSAQAAVMETGLGGRLDATNVVQPRVCVLTPIALDHREYLGESLQAIAGEKAGILKPGVPAVCAPQAPEAAEVLQARASRLGIRLQAQDPWPEPRPPLALAGEHQYSNAAGALTAVRLLLGNAYRPDRAHAGLLQARHPGRLQRLHMPGIAPGVEILLDGAHNPHGAEAVAAALSPTHLVFCCGLGRDPDALLQPFARHAPQRITFAAAPAPGLRGDLPGDTVLPDLTALPAYLRSLPGPACVLITGSLYLCGAVLALLPQNEPRDMARPSII